MNQSSRSRIVDAVEYIANNIAMISHLQEVINSGDNEEVTEEMISIARPRIQDLNESRRELMTEIKKLYNGNMHLWCALKHSIAMYGYATELLYANPDNIAFAKIQQWASETMYETLSQFIWQEVTTCWRCFNDEISE